MAFVCDGKKTNFLTWVLTKTANDGFLPGTSRFNFRSSPAGNNCSAFNRHLLQLVVARPGNSHNLLRLVSRGTGDGISPPIRVFSPYPNQMSSSSGQPYNNNMHQRTPQSMVPTVIEDQSCMMRITPMNAQRDWT